jgi:DNA mismatch endonuclease (patch repair protein)
MTDRFDDVTRSRVMSSVRHKSTAPELIVRRALHRAGMRFRLHDSSLPGRPDIVLPRYGAVVLVHGCFWHQHPGCRRSARPASNRKFWDAKLNANVERDTRTERKLRDAGWHVAVVWECGATDAELERLIKNLRPNRLAGSRHPRRN